MPKRIDQTPLPVTFDGRTASRRDFLRSIAAVALLTPAALPVHADLLTRLAAPLRAPDTNGLRLPAGFRSRIVAISGRTVGATGYGWHPDPDGGAVFPQADGGWIYVSNSEATFPLGGASAIRFDRHGTVRSAYRVLGLTGRNCAGGATPWGTWLSCEERESGAVWECDPTGISAPRRHKALGYFSHEAAAVDPVDGRIYMTEDETDGRLYRFSPRTRHANRIAAEGVLEVASVTAAGVVQWLPVPNPNPRRLPLWPDTPTRHQVEGSNAFKGGEGIWLTDRTLFFATKGDGRLWQLDLDHSRLSTLYRGQPVAGGRPLGVDNLCGYADGSVLVAEDNGDMRLVVVDRQGNTAPLVQIVGQNHSEITGPAFAPCRTRLYFSSQRGPDSGPLAGRGITYEVSADNAFG